MPVIIEEFESAALQGNCLVDPSRRRIPVYLPPSYANQPEKHYPVVFMLHGYSGNSLMWLNTNMFYQPTVPERFEQLIKAGKSGEMILVFVDGFNGLGCSQYLNSPASGRYEDYVIQDLVPYIDSKFRTAGTREGRAVAGKSSGGYGAVRLAMRHPEVFSAFASHAGDMYFELCYKPDFPKVVKALAKFMHTPNPVGAFLDEFAEVEQKGKLLDALNIVAMAACYSPHPDGQGMPPFDLPFDLYTGELKEEVWQRWLEHDPVYMLQKPEYEANLKQLKLIYLDAGTRDEFNLQLGARIFVQKARALGLQPHHEEFEDGHMIINYRYDVSLAKIWVALGPGSN
jgi:enterochelin esterase family protein